LVGLFIAAKEKGLGVLPATGLLVARLTKIIQRQQPDVDSGAGQCDEIRV